MKTVIIVCGPTASGKTAAAIRLAQHFGTAIISADSRQCYRELNIGVAKPSAEELALVPHYFISTHSITTPVNAALFETYSLDVCAHIFSDRDVVVMAGGTGLYIRAFCEGLDAIPHTPKDIRSSILANYQKKGDEWLITELRVRDPEFLESTDNPHPHRMLRALEVATHTGRAIASFKTASPVERPFRIIKIGLDAPRDELYARIDARVDSMIAAGLESEARALLVHRNLSSLDTVGYRELFDYFDGSHSLPGAVRLIQQNTRRYAKRQLTWFRKDGAIRWAEEWEPATVDALLRT